MDQIRLIFETLKRGRPLRPKRCCRFRGHSSGKCPRSYYRHLRPAACSSLQALWYMDMAGPQHSAPVNFASVFRPSSRSSHLHTTSPLDTTATTSTPSSKTTRRFASLRGLHDRPTTSRLKKQPTTASTSTSTVRFQEKQDELGAMIDATGPKSRRERTLIGTECAACEEPLEHTLRGERILQLSCGHVAHEACFYEFIKEFESQECPSCNAPLGLDTSRGGNLNFGNTDRATRPLCR